MNESRKYGDAVRDAIKAHGMSQTQFGELVGWSQSIVSDLVRGERSLIPPDVVRTIAEALEIPVRRQLEMLGYLDEDEPEPGVAYIVRTDDPRKAILDMLEGMAPVELALFARIAAAIISRDSPPNADSRNGRGAVSAL